MGDGLMRPFSFGVAGVVSLVAVLAMQASASAQAGAQDWPDRPVKIIVAFGAGGTIDTATRIIADKLSQKWQQGVVVDNRPGASGNIGAVAAARATPDGYTLHMGGQPLTANVTLSPVANFNPLTDFEPIIFVNYAQDVLLVGKDSNFKSVPELVAAAKAKPDSLDYSSLGTGSSGHLATVLLQDVTGMRARHVPFSNVGQMQTDVAAGRITFWIVTLGGQLGVIKGGALRALAVSGEARARELPDIPTFKELGIPLVEPSSWFGLFAPKGTPRELVTRLNGDVNDLLKTPEMQDKFAALGFTIVGGAPAVLSRAMEGDVEKWRKVSRSPAYATP